ncbi:MAG: 2-hydroxyacyl-CoA dehydratase family protein [Myxococcota bacterium]|nr:2-hydroxyacyl-CoA dehydratase family protein [Myxococcota bacterium]
MTLNIKIPGRMHTIAAHRENSGLVAAVFPIHYPRALFRAHGILPVEVWGPPIADKTLGDSHLQAYTCSIARLGLSYLMGGGLDVADMFVVPHCCDTLQGLGSLIRDFIPRDKPCFTLYLPREKRDADIAFFAEELSTVAAELQGMSNKAPTHEALIEAIETEARATAAADQLMKRRLYLPCTNRAFYELVRSREYLPAEQFTSLANQALAAVEDREKQGLKIVLSGVVPEPMDLLDVLEDMGAVVVADDFLSTGRRLYPPPGRHADPLTRMAESVVNGPPDATRGCSFDDRLAHLLGLVQESGAAGVIFYHAKFCEPEQFYLPALKKGLEAAGIPSYRVEQDIGDALPGQMVTRLEAFLEMLS